MTERRNLPRMNLTGSMLYTNNGSIKRGRLLDMNKSILKFSCDESLPVGAVIGISVDISNLFRKIKATVLTVRIPQNGPYPYEILVAINTEVCRINDPKQRSKPVFVLPWFRTRESTHL